MRAGVGGEKVEGRENENKEIHENSHQLPGFTAAKTGRVTEKFNHNGIANATVNQARPSVSVNCHRQFRKNDVREKQEPRPSSSRGTLARSMVILEYSLKDREIMVDRGEAGTQPKS